jgi:hypothetical protein
MKKKNKQKNQKTEEPRYTEAEGTLLMICDFA